MVMRLTTETPCTRPEQGARARASSRTRIMRMQGSITRRLFGTTLHRRWLLDDAPSVPRGAAGGGAARRAGTRSDQVELSTAA